MTAKRTTELLFRQNKPTIVLETGAQTQKSSLKRMYCLTASSCTWLSIEDEDINTGDTHNYMSEIGTCLATAIAPKETDPRYQRCYLTGFSGYLGREIVRQSPAAIRFVCPIRSKHGVSGEDRHTALCGQSFTNTSWCHPLTMPDVATDVICLNAFDTRCLSKA